MISINVSNLTGQGSVHTTRGIKLQEILGPIEEHLGTVLFRMWQKQRSTPFSAILLHSFQNVTYQSENVQTL